MEYNKPLCPKKRDNDQAAQESLAYARRNFSLLSLIRSYPDNDRAVEMSFDLTNYQPQVRHYDNRIMNITPITTYSSQVNLYTGCDSEVASPSAI